MVFLAMKKLIIGATGSIGSALSKKLKDQGDDVHKRVSADPCSCAKMHIYRVCRYMCPFSLGIFLF